MVLYTRKSVRHGGEGREGKAGGEGKGREGRTKHHYGYSYSYSTVLYKEKGKDYTVRYGTVQSLRSASAGHLDTY